MAEATRKSVTLANPSTSVQDAGHPKTSAAAHNSAALRFQRFFSKASISPYDEVQWERRNASITDASGKTIF